MKCYRIYQDQSVPENTNRIIHDQLKIIAGHCSEQEDIQVSIHEIRKSCKRIRAVLRLVRDNIGYSTYLRENVFYRDLARTFSVIRDYEVLCNSMKILREKQPDELKSIVSSRVLEYFTELRDRYLEDLLNESDPFGYVLHALEAAKTRVDQFYYTHDNFSGMGPGLERIYRQGRRLKKIVENRYTPEEFHNFRKRSKYLLYQIQLLKKVYKPTLKGYAKSLSIMTDRLGDYRDFDQLAEYLNHQRIPGFTKRKSENLVKMIEAEKIGLYKKAMRLSDLVYAESPRAFINRMESYWNASLKHKIK